MNVKLLIIFLSLSGTLKALDNEILGFNIGGHSFQVARSLFSSLESPLLNNPEQSEYFVPTDNHGYFYISLSSEEGKLIEHFIHYKSLPKRYDIFIARQAIEHFSIKQMQSWISDNPPERRAVRMWTSHISSICAYNSCFHCEKLFYGNNSGTMFEASAHLINIHGATIHATFFAPARNDDERKNHIDIQYSLPQD